MATMTLAELRHVARLFHQGVGGAREQLAAQIADHAEDLPSVVGFAPDQLERLAKSEDPVSLLVATLDRVPEVRRRSRARQQREAAVALATTLVDTACRDDQGAVHVDARLLAEIVARCGSRAIRFGDGAVETARLRALLRACRGLTDLDVAITHDRLVVRYASHGVRGTITLWLFPISPKVEALRVPLERVARADLVEEAVVEATVALDPPVLVEPSADDDSNAPSVPATAPERLEPKPDRRRPRRLLRFLEAASHHFREAA